MATSAYGKAVKRIARLEDEVRRLKEAGKPAEDAERKRDAAIGEAVRELHIDGHQLLKDAMASNAAKARKDGQNG